MNIGADPFTLRARHTNKQIMACNKRNKFSRFELNHEQPALKVDKRPKNSKVGTTDLMCQQLINIGLGFGPIPSVNWQKGEKECPIG